MQGSDPILIRASTSLFHVKAGPDNQVIIYGAFGKELPWYAQGPGFEPDHPRRTYMPSLIGLLEVCTMPSPLEQLRRDSMFGDKKDS